MYLPLQKYLAGESLDTNIKSIFFFSARGYREIRGGISFIFRVYGIFVIRSKRNLIPNSPNSPSGKYFLDFVV